MRTEMAIPDKFLWISGEISTNWFTAILWHFQLSYNYFHGFFLWFELFSIILDTLFGGLKSLILNGLIYILKLPFCCLTPFCVGFDQKCSWKRWDNVQKIKSYKFHRRKNLIWKTNLINFTIKMAAINKLFVFYCIDIKYSEKFIH